jgi:hypothetical protein
MNTSEEPLNTLKDIRNLMESSTRFLSLSGLSGVFIGIIAIMGAVAAYYFLDIGFDNSDYYRHISHGDVIEFPALLFFLWDAILVLVLSLAFGFFFTYSNAKKKNQAIWSPAAKNFLIHLFVPLFVGGIFCLALVYHHLIYLIAPSMLIFYGLALINASKYTLSMVKYLGLFEVILGLISAFMIGYGILFWALGFGVLHIIYGILMYNKYEK